MNQLQLESKSEIDTFSNSVSENLNLNIDFNSYLSFYSFDNKSDFFNADEYLELYKNISRTNKSSYSTDEVSNNELSLNFSNDVNHFTQIHKTSGDLMNLVNGLSSNSYSELNKDDQQFMLKTSSPINNYFKLDKDNYSINKSYSTLSTDLNNFTSARESSLIIKKRLLVKKRTFDKSNERQFLTFINTIMRRKLSKNPYLELFHKPSYVLFNNKFRNLSKRKEILQKSLFDIFLNNSNYDKEICILNNQKIIEELVEKDSNLLEYIKCTSIGSFITPDTIDEVLNSLEFKVKISRKVNQNEVLDISSAISNIRKLALKCIY